MNTDKNMVMVFGEEEELLYEVSVDGRQFKNWSMFQSLVEICEMNLVQIQRKVLGKRFGYQVSKENCPV